MKGIRYLIPVFILLSQQASAQLRSFKASTDKKKIVIGEQVQLTLEAVVPKNNSLQWFWVDTLPHFEILQKSKLDSQVIDDKNLQLSQRFTVTSWDSGRWIIPSFSLPQYKNVRTTPIPVDVSFSPFNPEQDYHDIKEIIDVQKPERITWYWYLAGTALLLAIFLLLFPRRKKEKTGPGSDPGTYKQALAALEKLKKEKGTDTKGFYTELIIVFRTYVYKRKGIQSFQKTTDDLSVQLKSLSMPAEQYNNLVQVLRLSDTVKFAKFIPADTENDAALEAIRKSIMNIENLS